MYNKTYNILVQGWKLMKATNYDKTYIKCYELDLLVYDDENGHIKRPDKVREKMFKDILKKKNWIIEDVGRSKFEEGRKHADIIYYINNFSYNLYR